MTVGMSMVMPLSGVVVGDTLIMQPLMFFFVHALTSLCNKNTGIFLICQSLFPTDARIPSIFRQENDSSKISRSSNATRFSSEYSICLE